MLTSRLLLVFVAICFSLTASVIVDPQTNVQPQVQLRTWDQAIAMAKAFVAQLSLQEKCHLTAGVGGPCVGNIASLPRVNFSGFCIQDTPSGVGDFALYSTAFASGIHIAATWDRDLFYQRATAIGEEFRGKGLHYAFGPLVNIDRNARHGRNWEGFGSDPYLSGENAFFYVQGIQDQGVVASPKHYICNEQETNRSFVMKGVANTGVANNGGAYSVNLDDKTMHEVYLWPFASSVAAGAGSIMCSGNEINGTRSCQNDKTQNGLLKGELGYKGNILTDWMGSKSTVEPVLAGLDIDMPGKDGYMGDALVPFVQNGSIPESRVDDMAIRIIAPYYLVGQDQNYPSVDPDRNAMADHYIINREVGRAGMILLKNVNNVLPLDASVDTNIYIYGEAAGQSDYGFKTGGLEGHAGALYQGGGSGFVQPTYGIDPLSELMAKARDSHLHIRYVTNQSDYNFINGTFRSRGFDQAKCLVFISAFSSEGVDRSSLHALDNGDQLVQTVASHCTNTIVIVNSVSQLNLEAWIDLPNVVGVVWTGMPGLEYGPAIVDVLFGDYNPGGKLVFTLAKNDSDYGTDISPAVNITYSEGVFLDYRHFDKYNITPRYHFGYGLSYTTFSFAKLQISQANHDDKHSPASLYKQRRMRPYNNFGDSGLYDPVYTITFTLTNTGNYYGSEVAQLYLGFPAEAEEPAKILRGFERVYLTSGESREVTLILSRKDVSYWNVINQQWTVAPGAYTVWISTSANNADVKLQGSFHV